MTTRAEQSAFRDLTRDAVVVMDYEQQQAGHAKSEKVAPFSFTLLVLHSEGKLKNRLLHFISDISNWKCHTLFTYVCYFKSSVTPRMLVIAVPAARFTTKGLCCVYNVCVYVCIILLLLLLL